MDSALLETEDRFLLMCSATLIPEDKEIAWAQSMVKENPNVAWALGRYVQADVANLNNQTFALADLQKAYPSVTYAPVNINHDYGRIRGFFAASELLYPTGETEGAAEVTQPYVEALAGVWKRYFPQDYAQIQEAAAGGRLSFSMESVPTHLRCTGAAGCNKEFAYEGRDSVNYCACIRNRISDKQLVNPSFIGGALVIPPAKPAWSDADIYSLVANEIREAATSEELSEAQSMLDFAISAARGLQTPTTRLPNQVFDVMTISQRAFFDAGESREMARSFSVAERKSLAAKGQAMPGGSFPTPTAADWHNAWGLRGHAPNKAAVTSYLIRRAKSLGIPASAYSNADS